MILLTHNMVEVDQLAKGIGIGAYAAITQFHALVLPFVAFAVVFAFAFTGCDRASLRGQQSLSLRLC